MAQLDFSQDFLCWDNASSVLYQSTRRVPSIVDLPPRFDGQPAPVPTPPRNQPLLITVAKRRNLTMREQAASGGAYSSLDQVWILPDALFPAGVTSKPGDAVIELQDGSPEQQPGARWTVLEVGWGKNRQTRRLTCRDLVLSADLRDLVTVERPALSYDEAGVPVKAFPSDPVNPGGVVLYASLPARVQLVTKAVEEERGIRGLGARYDVTVGYEVDVSQEDRLLLDNGIYLDVVGYRNAQRIDELPVIECVRKV